MNVFRHILLFLVSFIVLLSCGKDNGRVIPRGKLAVIYADMFMMDQWINNNPGVRRVADTSLVYEPVFAKYGYTSEDYRRTVTVYMNDPERFSRILRKTGTIFDARIAELKKREKQLEQEEALQRKRESLRMEQQVDVDGCIPYLQDESVVHYYDSISVERDSIIMMYRFKSIDRGDTIYRNLRMIILDSLVVHEAPADTLEQENL